MKDEGETCKEPTHFLRTVQGPEPRGELVTSPTYLLEGLE